MRLSTPITVRKLQAALHAKAKESPSFRFYSLYDKIYREDILHFAYRRCRHNGGSAGVDGESFVSIESRGLESWLGDLAQELRTKSYRPRPVLRRWIPKPNGGRRPLGIPAIRDRVVQMAATLVLEPIFEADLPRHQYAYRPGRSAHDAIRQVHSLINTGHREVIDADLSGYFDTIPHGDLLKSVARRISDGRVLGLIKAWLKVPVEEVDRRGRRQRTTPGRNTGRGTPQGAPISPLLSNLYMRRLVLGWEVLGYRKRFGAEIVAYADDLVICCRRQGAEALMGLQHLTARLGLTLNESKTRLCFLPEDTFDFLGYTLGRCYSSKDGHAYLGTRPSRQAVQRICRRVSELTSRRWLLLDAANRVALLNRVLIGWSRYFSLGPVSKAYSAVDHHTCRRLRRWLRKKHKVQGRGTSRFPDARLHEEFGLVQLRPRTRSFPWANA